MFLGKVNSTSFNNAKNRLIQFLGFGPNDVQKHPECMPYGLDCNPIKDMIAVYAQTAAGAQSIVIGYINKNQLADVGEMRIYSTDNNGNLKAYVWCKNDGNVKLNGDQDNAVRFKPTKDVIVEIQDDIKALKDAFTLWEPVPEDGGAALKSAASTWAGTPLTKSIDPAKIDNVLTS